MDETAPPQLFQLVLILLGSALFIAFTINLILADVQEILDRRVMNALKLGEPGAIRRGLDDAWSSAPSMRMALKRSGDAARELFDRTLATSLARNARLARGTTLIKSLRPASADGLMDQALIQCYKQAQYFPMVLTHRMRLYAAQGKPLEALRSLLALGRLQAAEHAPSLAAALGLAGQEQEIPALLPALAEDLHQPMMDAAAAGTRVRNGAAEALPLPPLPPADEAQIRRLLAALQQAQSQFMKKLDTPETESEDPEAEDQSDVIATGNAARVAAVLDLVRASDMVVQMPEPLQREVTELIQVVLASQSDTKSLTAPVLVGLAMMLAGPGLAEDPAKRLLAVVPPAEPVTDSAAEA